MLKKRNEFLKLSQCTVAVNAGGVGVLRVPEARDHVLETPETNLVKVGELPLLLGADVEVLMLGFHRCNTMAVILLLRLALV